MPDWIIVSNVMGYLNSSLVARKVLTYTPQFHSFPAAPLLYPPDDKDICERQALISWNLSAPGLVSRDSVSADHFTRNVGWLSNEYAIPTTFLKMLELMEDQ